MINVFQKSGIIILTLGFFLSGFSISYALECRGIFFDSYYQNITGGCPSGNFYYVDINNPQASDSNPGTEALPWRTMQKAFNTLTAGQVGIIKAGEYTAVPVNSRYIPALNPANNGTAGNPIVFKALGDVYVHAVPTEYGSVQAATTRTITLDSTASGVDDYYDGWKVRIVSGTGAGQVRNILYSFSDLSQVSYYGNTKLAYVQYPWDIIPDATSRYSLTERGPIMGTNGRSHIVIDGFRMEEIDNYAADTGNVVIWASNNVVLMNNDILAQAQPLYDNHNAIRIEGSQNFTVRNNKIHGVLVSINLSNNPQNHAAIMLYNSSNGIIEHNEIYDSYTCLFPKSNNNGIVIRYNHVHGCVKCLRISNSQNSLIHQNLFNNCTGMVFQPAENNVNNRLFNNIFANSASGINNWFASSNFSLFNNIFYNTTYPFKFESALGVFSSDYNNYYGYTAFNAENRNVGDLNAWKLLGYDAGSLSTNPLFVDASTGNFRLQSNSPARTLGVDILDLDNDGSTTDTIPAGAYITGNETIGLITGGTTPPPPTPKVGDLNNDNLVNIYDYNILVGNFGRTGSSISGDIDSNGTVNIFDYNLLVGNFGR